MSMLSAQINITGLNYLLQNNPQTVDRFNSFAKKIAAINAKKTKRTDDDYIQLRKLEVESKMYFDDEKMAEQLSTTVEVDEIYESLLSLEEQDVK